MCGEAAARRQKEHELYKAERRNPTHSNLVILPVSFQTVDKLSLGVLKQFLRSHAGASDRSKFWVYYRTLLSGGAGGVEALRKC